MPYRTVRKVEKTPTGTKTVVRREWYEIPKRHTVMSLLGSDAISKFVASEAIDYEYNGRLYTDTPAEMIEKMDEALWNNDIEFARRAYAMVNKAKEKIKNLKEIEADKVGKKGTNQMKHNNFRSIFTELKQVYANAYSVCKKIFAEYDQAKKEWDSVSKNASLNARERILAESDYIRAEEKFKAAYEEITDATKSRVSELKKALDDAVSMHYKIKPEKMDASALKLLELGILKDSDIVQMAEDNSNNPTMLAVIRKFAKERGESVEMRMLEQGICRLLDDKKELKAFDSLCDYGARSYGTDVAKRNAFEKMFDKMFDSVIENVSDDPFDNEGEISKREN